MDLRVRLCLPRQSLLMGRMRFVLFLYEFDLPQVYETRQHVRDWSGEEKSSVQRGINEQAKKIVREKFRDGERTSEHYRNVATGACVLCV